MALISDLAVTQIAWSWAALGAALLALEVVTGSGWLLWPAAAAGVVAVTVAFAHIPVPAAVLVFAVLTIVATLTARRYYPRRNPDDPGDINDSVARLVGREGRVTSAFQAGAGRVFVDGKEWSAELDGDAALEPGDRVEVVGVAGSRLQVRAVSAAP